MKVFSLYIQSAVKCEQIDNLVSFVGEDLSGSFGILPNHSRMLTSLKFGLARFRDISGKEEYIALPQGILYFIDNKLKIATRHYLLSDNYKEITLKLEQQLLAEESSMSNVKEMLHNLDEKILKHLWQLERGVEA